MAGLAGGVGMRAGQLKRCSGMIKGGWLPGRSGVTGLALRAKLTSVRVVIYMAASAEYRRAGKDLPAVSSILEVTVLAGSLEVRSRELESCQGMVVC
jgi:hypothetical protein